MGYYDREAPRYDATRGGRARARAAAAAVHALVDAGSSVVDVAGGTGSVSAELARLGHPTVVVDTSPGMLRLAAGRLPGRVAVASAARLPMRDAAVEAVSTIWLLHLLTPAQADVVVAETARVLAAGGCWVTSVDKRQSHGEPGAESDDAQRLVTAAHDVGLVEAGERRFDGASVWGSATDRDPVFRLLAFRRGPR